MATKELLKKTLAVWVWLWSDGTTELHTNAPVDDDYIPCKRTGLHVVATTSISSVVVEEGTFA